MASAPAPGLTRHRQPGSVGGRGSRPDAGRRPRAGAAAQAASGSRSWCRRRGCTLDVGGRLTDGGQVDAEQLRAPLQRRRDRPAQVRVVPVPHQTRVSNTSSTANRERYVVRRGRSEPGGPRWGRNSAEPGGQQRTAGDNRRRGQQPFHSVHLARETPGLRFHTAEPTWLCQCTRRSRSPSTSRPFFAADRGGRFLLPGPGEALVSDRSHSASARPSPGCSGT
jgi:hypothetical protein